MNSTDYLRDYTAPRAVLVGVLFLTAVLFRMPAVVLAMVVHVLDRGADRLLAVAGQVPPAPVRTVTRRGRARS
ncbi:hypothetical protein [Saccharopolyspora taberi]|uniref:Uncharacterized protein n=1 Tax=Saccharopolyspora taberi TaxID=60895 RepID=A0ABN3V4K9_9PSEU